MSVHQLQGYFEFNRRWRLRDLSHATGVAEIQLEAMLTRANGFCRGAGPQHWYSFNPLVAVLNGGKLVTA